MLNIKNQEAMSRAMKKSINLSALELITVISKNEVENLWGLKSNPEIKKGHYFQAELKKLQKSRPENDYYIIYLSGISILEQINSAASNKIRFRNGSMDCETIVKTSPPGYYLVKIKRTELQKRGNTCRLPPLPLNWKRASIRDASEIILIIFLIQGEKKYLGDWHACYEYGGSGLNHKSINKIRFSREREDQIEIVNQGTNSKPSNLKTNSITLKRLL